MNYTRMIKSSQALTPLVDEAAKAGYVAVDTEFVWERTYYPALGIVQLAVDRDKTGIVDMPAMADTSALGKLLADPNVTKILHDAPQDLTILRRVTGAFPCNIFDTRLAAGFAGMSASLSLSILLREILGVKLAKTETRSNWLKRPLTRRQIEYALDDVRYLPDLREQLLQKVGGKGHLAWLNEELQLYDNPSLYEEGDAREQFLRIKGISKLSNRRRSILRELALWREELAREENRPRFWVASDHVLLKLAQERPSSLSELKSVEGLGEPAVKGYGEQILQAVHRGLDKREKEGAKTAQPPEGADRLGARVDLALAYIKGKSLTAGIDPDLLCSRSDLTSLMQEISLTSSPEHRLLHGWRWAFVGRDLARLIDGELSVRMDKKKGLPVRDDNDT